MRFRRSRTQIKTLVEIARPCCQANGVFQTKFRFMDCLVKGNALVSGNRQHISVIVTVNSIIVFTKQPSAERYLANIFSQDFCELLANSWRATKNRSEKFQKVHKKTPVTKSYFRKVAGFYRSSHPRCSVKKVFLETCSQNSQENICFRDSILIKLQA